MVQTRPKVLLPVLVMGLTSFCVQAESYNALDRIQTRATKDVQAQAVRDLIGRLLPERAGLFDVQIEPSLPEEKHGFFQIFKATNDSVVFIKGSTGVLAAWGFHYYLTQHCRCQVSWDADQLNLPATLPDVSIRIASIDKFRYYQNVCTVSYSSAFWQWSRWEREIDWMALNGINLPLAFTGQEVIWQRVYLSLGLTQQEIDEHFSGPAFFAWQRMGNIRAWGGPLSDNWQRSTLALQHQILDRMRSFGMLPVLPAFAGHIPRAVERVYPNANYTYLTPWLGFEDQYCCPLFVQPTEPLFRQIGTMFIQEMVSEFGTDHVYNCDVFNEVSPTQSDPPFVSSVGKAVYDAMTTADPDAIWMMQGWLFKYDYEYWTADLAEALLTSVPQGRMLLLDLQAELDPQYIRLNSFYGQPFIFCLLHNFGGTLGLYGVIPPLTQRVIDARNYPNSTMVGTGLTMEGIDQNYIVYDNMLELGWRDKVPDLNLWFDEYTIRRYGVNNTNIMSAWKFLQRSVYNASADVFYRGRYSLLSRRPSLAYKPKPSVWYDPLDVIRAWDFFILASSDTALASSPNFRHDLIDVSRQSVQETFQLLYRQLVASYYGKNVTTFGGVARQMLDLLDDLDGLLQTGGKFLLGKWIADARSWGYTEGEKIQYEWNARNQITLWGPKGEIVDYAIKQWAGVVADYLKPRWEVFIQQLGIALDTGVVFNQTAFVNTVFNDVENPFTYSAKLYPDVPSGDTITAARNLYTKWRSVYQPSKDLVLLTKRHNQQSGRVKPTKKKQKPAVRQ